MTNQTPPPINPYQAPQTEVYQNFNQDEPELAGRWGRLFAAIIDALISLLVSLPIFFFTGVFSSIMEGGELSVGMQVGMGVYGFIAYLLIHGYLLNKHGQTVGKLLMGIYIADVDTGEKSDIKNIILKRVLPVTLVNFIPVVGSFISVIDALLIFRGDKRCGHDLIAGTHVLKVTSNH